MSLEINLVASSVMEYRLNSRPERRKYYYLYFPFYGFVVYGNFF